MKSSVVSELTNRYPIGKQNREIDNGSPKKICQLPPPFVSATDRF